MKKYDFVIKILIAEKQRLVGQYALELEERGLQANRATKEDKVLRINECIEIINNFQPDGIRKKINCPDCGKTYLYYLDGDFVRCKCGQLFLKSVLL